MSGAIGFAGAAPRDPQTRWRAAPRQAPVRAPDGAAPRWSTARDEPARCADARRRRSPPRRDGCWPRAIPAGRRSPRAVRRATPGRRQGARRRPSGRRRWPRRAAPSRRNRAACTSSCARHSAKQSSSGFASPGTARQRANDRAESRPLASSIGMPRRLVASNRLGHSSDSTQIARSGRQWSRNRSTARGRSTGTNWCRARGGRRSAEQPRRGDRAGGHQYLDRRAARPACARSAPAPIAPRRRWRRAPRRASRAGAPRRQAETFAKPRRVLLAAPGAPVEIAPHQRRRRGGDGAVERGPDTHGRRCLAAPTSKPLSGTAGEGGAQREALAG